MAIVIERLRGLPVDALGALIAESEQAGLRFVRRLVEEWGTGANRFDRSGEALFAAWVDGQLVGVPAAWSGRALGDESHRDGPRPFRGSPTTHDEFPGRAVLRGARLLSRRRGYPRRDARHAVSDCAPNRALHPTNGLALLARRRVTASLCAPRKVARVRAALVGVASGFGPAGLSSRPRRRRRRLFS
jgi:hypothetical protein